MHQLPRYASTTVSKDLSDDEQGAESDGRSEHPDDDPAGLGLKCDDEDMKPKHKRVTSTSDPLTT